jgi:hypothetical protein
VFALWVEIVSGHPLSKYLMVVHAWMHDFLGVERGLLGSRTGYRCNARTVVLDELGERV